MMNEFMEEEKPYFMYNTKLKDDEIDRLTDPEDTTNFGDVPHRAKKGVIPVSPQSNYYRKTSVTLSDKTGM